jgi:hypothetical protein
LENILYNELCVRGFAVDTGVIEATGQNRRGSTVRKQQEIDFVCNMDSRRYYIQSRFSLPDEEQRLQEERLLLMTGDGFKKVIISRDVLAPHYTENGILMLNVFDFLLNPDSLSY